MKIEQTLEKLIEDVPLGQRIIDVPRVDLQGAIIEIRKLNAIIKCDDKIIEDQAVKIVEFQKQITELLSENVNIGLLNMTDQTQKLQKAIELLKACSQELFINGSNIALETEVDEFLIEKMGEKPLCVSGCSNCEQCPSTLRTQAE